jgi:hypothetical protein
VEEPRLGDAPCHHGTSHPVHGEAVDEGLNLAGADPRDDRGMAFDGRVGLAEVRHGNHVHAVPLRSLREEHREVPVAGDQPDPFATHGRHTPRSEALTKSSMRETSGVSPNAARVADRASLRAPSAWKSMRYARLSVRTVSSENPRRLRPTTFSPKSRARSPAAVQNGGTSSETMAPAAQRADSPTRANWCTPARPPTIA